MTTALLTDAAGLDVSGLAVLIGAIFTGLSGTLAGLGAFVAARRRRSDDDYAALKKENGELQAEVRKLRAYVTTLYAYAVKLFRWLVREGHNPDPVPEEDGTP